jgi:hypothetical protein
MSGELFFYFYGLAGGMRSELLHDLPDSQGPYQSRKDPDHLGYLPASGLDVRRRRADSGEFFFFFFLLIIILVNTWVDIRTPRIRQAIIPFYILSNPVIALTASIAPCIVCSCGYAAVARGGVDLWLVPFNDTLSVP